MTKPYTYLLKWDDGKKYYGVRYANGCTPEDLFKTYFTSSAYVKKRIDEGNLPSEIKVRKVFSNAIDAIEWEYKVLKKISAARRDDYLNKSYGGKVNTTDVEIRKKISETVTKRWADGTYDGMFESRDYKGENNPMYGKRVSDFMDPEANTRRLEKISKAITGKKHTQKTKKKMAEYAKKRMWMINKEGKLKHTTNINHPLLLSGEYKLGKKWSN